MGEGERIREGERIGCKSRSKSVIGSIRGKNKGVTQGRESAFYIAERRYEKRGSQIVGTL